MLFLTSFVSCASITVVVSVLLCVVVNVLLSCIMTKTQHGDGKKKRRTRRTRGRGKVFLHSSLRIRPKDKENGVACMVSSVMAMSVSSFQVSKTLAPKMINSRNCCPVQWN